MLHECPALAGLRLQFSSLLLSCSSVMSQLLWAKDQHEVSRYIIACLDRMIILPKYQRFEVPSTRPGARGEGLCVLFHPAIAHGIRLWRTVPSASAIWVVPVAQHHRLGL